MEGNMINQVNMQLGKVRSCIRELFEYGKKRKAEIGAENVFDFSLGNPSVPAPQEVGETIKYLIDNMDPVYLHGYTSAQGDANVRSTIAAYINSSFGTNLNGDCIYMTCGAAASLCITLNALLNDGDEVITFAPFFPEYNVFVAHAGGRLVPVQGKKDTFQIDIDNLKSALSDKTKAVIINSPNNPGGVVYSEQVIIELCDILRAHSAKIGAPVYLISDEPYRQLVFDEDTFVPYVMNYYDNSIVCYSYSKSLSLPGERIGYIAVNNKIADFTDVYAAVCGAGRALGYVCAPNLFQQLVAKLVDKTSDINVYKSNRDVLCGALTEYGYTVVKPDGAFYLFVKALEDDAEAFAERAKKFELLLVPGDSFGVKGYVRISYCVSPDMIKKSLPAFKALAQSYKK
jgi:aspartate aminotransferase